MNYGKVVGWTCSYCHAVVLSSLHLPDPNWVGSILCICSSHPYRFSYGSSLRTHAPAILDSVWQQQVRPDNVWQCCCRRKPATRGFVSGMYDLPNHINGAKGSSLNKVIAVYPAVSPRLSAWVAWMLMPGVNHGSGSCQTARRPRKRTITHVSKAFAALLWLGLGSDVTCPQ